MAVVPMEKITIWALRRDRKSILEKLQMMGIMQIQTEMKKETGFFQMDTAGQKHSFEQESLLADESLQILQKYAPRKSPSAMLTGRKKWKPEKYQEVLENKADVLEAGAAVRNAEKKIESCRAQILKLQNQIEALEPWKKLDLPMNFTGTAHTSFLLGTLPAGKSMEREAVLEVLGEAVIQLEILQENREGIRLAILSSRKEEGAVEAILSKRGFVRVRALCEKNPREEQAELKNRICGLETEIEELEQEIRRNRGYRTSLQVLSDYFRIRAQKYEILGNLQQSKKVFCIQGYLPKKYFPVLEREMQSYETVQIDREDFEPEEEIPVLLENQTFAGAAEGILESYGLPKRGEMDPTGIMAVFYVFLFGLMLADAAYGFLISAVCFFLLKRFPDMERSLKKSLRLFGFCGISTLIWGILFGSYFGDALNVISETFFHVTIPEGGIVRAFWFVPLDDPMKMLLYSMGFGLVHLFTGLGLKGYRLLREGRRTDFFCEVLLWYFLLFGLLMILIPGEMFSSIAQLPSGMFPSWIPALGKLLAFAGAFGILLTAGRHSRNIGVRLAMGLYGLYGVTGWLSDVLSYSRLLALGLATGVIASVVNQIGVMFGGGVLGAVFFTVVFLVGHTFNLAINILGAYVHTNRLQYVEFFGKFYEGGGKPFTPFRADTKYMDIKEEIHR